MGGISSGRFRTINRGAVEHVPAFDSRKLRRAGYLSPGITTAGAWRWSFNDRPSSTIGFAVSFSENCRGTFDLKFSQDGIPKCQTIPIVGRPCRFGGHRFYFVCPIYGAPVEVIVASGARFMSRKAAGLTYRSQSKTPLERLMQARDKAKARALGREGYPRPRGRNRERLEDRWNELVAATEDLFEAESMRRFGAMF